QSGGAIGISSELGKGTTAQIYLPQTDAGPPAPAEKTASFMPLNGAETILLVEDEARVRKLMLDVLTGRGYKVLEATRGEEALRLCKQHRKGIDMAIVDVVMPEMSGPDLVKQMSPVCPAIRVLYISGYTDEA